MLDSKFPITNPPTVTSHPFRCKNTFRHYQVTPDMSAWDVEEDHSQGRKGKSGHNAKVQLPATSQEVMMILIASLGCRWDGDILGNDCLGKGDNQHVEEGGEAFAANSSPEICAPAKKDWISKDLKKEMWRGAGESFTYNPQQSLQSARILSS